jgi:hypothetical protein
MLKWRLKMKTLKSFLFVALMTVLVPVASSALLDDVVCGLLPCGETTPPPPSVPEPSGALIMGAALLTLAVVRRQARK